MTKLAIAKTAAHMIVALNTARFTSNQIVEHTDVPADSIALKVGSMVVGEMVASKTDPITDGALDRVATWWSARKDAKNAE